MFDTLLKKARETFLDHDEVQPSAPDLDLLFFFDPIAENIEEYFDAEVRGMNRVPDEAALLAGNHSGGIMTPDTFIFLREYYHHTNFEDGPVILAHSALFEAPVIRDVLIGGGAIPASRNSARGALDEGRKVLVYPGGDWEVHRPSSERDTIDFGGRKGFVTLAMEAGVPIVPVVAAGAHDGWYVVTRGEKIAKALLLDRLFRIKVFPIAFAAPMGLLVGPLTLHWPMPTKIIIEVLDPIDVEGDPNDADAVDAAYERVVDTMQDTLTRLADELGH
jgi:1-acyl-sn-glycerol-3-phosphate acyltransferase